MNINVDISPGELIDKITILEIKLERIPDQQKLDNIRIEYTLLKTTKDECIPPSKELDGLTSELKAINEKLWQIEDDIRDCERNGDFSDTFLQLARSVYFSNDKRAALKREINTLLGSTIVEEKSYQEY